jgi:hypothetical protein
MVAALTGTFYLGNPVVFDAVVTLGIGAGVLAGVAMAQFVRSRPPNRPIESLPEKVVLKPAERAEPATQAEAPPKPNGSSEPPGIKR